MLSPGLAAKVDKAARRRWEKVAGKPKRVIETPTNERVEPTVALLGECESNTKAGAKCKRRAETGSRFCHAHREKAT